jgi:peptide/nickel transport system permease protein
VKFLARRLAFTLPTLFGMSVFIFVMVRLMPGNVVDVLSGGDVSATKQSRAAIARALGLDVPAPLQYFRWIVGSLHGYLGTSVLTGRPIGPTLGAAFPITAELALLALIFATLLAVPLGVYAATRANSKRDVAIRAGALVGLSVPDFWLATLTLLFTSVVFRWTPPTVWSPFWANPLRNLTQVALPAGILAVYLLSSTMRMTRASMLDVLREDYVRTARSKGLPRRGVVYRHALPNALVPVLTLTGVQAAGLISGATILETVFGLPGVGYTLTQAVFNRDYPLIESAALVLAILVVIINLLVDLLNGVVDPRQRLT